MKTLTFRILTLVVFFLGINAQAKPRVFTNTAGKQISGTVQSASDKDVTIKLDSGREITGGIKFFSEADQKFIAEWKKKNPAQYKYDFDIKVSKKRTDRKKQTEGSTIVVYEDWAYKIEIENRSKVGIDGAKVDKLDLHYNIVKTAEANANQARIQLQGMSPHKGTFTKSGKISIGEIKYLRSKNVETAKVAINKSELAPGWYYSDGSKDEAEDELKGIWIKIVRNGETIHEEKIGSKDLENAKWFAPRGTSKSPN